MRKIPLNNPEILKKLEEAHWYRQPHILEHFNQSGSGFNSDDQKWFTSHEYFNKIRDMKRNHDGFPEAIQAWSMQYSTMRAKSHGDTKIKQEVYRKQSDYMEWWHSHYCLRTNALFAIYEPGGFISWHNNANAAAYNCILTWSETGDGYFEWYDQRNKKMVRWDDEPGWQCRLGYFGGYEDDWNDLVYHTAKTNCWRMTISFTFDRSEQSQMMQQWLVDDLMAFE